MEYDTAKLSFVRAEAGNFLGPNSEDDNPHYDGDPNDYTARKEYEDKWLEAIKNNSSITFLYSNDQKRGRVVVGLTKLGQVDGVSGDGILCKIVFKTLDTVTAWESPIKFSNASLRKMKIGDEKPTTVPDAKFFGGKLIFIP